MQRHSCKHVIPSPVAQSVAKSKPPADPGVASSIPVWHHTQVEIDHEIISTVILLPLIHEGLVSVMHEILVNRLVKPAKKNSVVR